MKRTRETGNIIVFTALGMTVLLGMGGLAVDVGALRHEKRLQQTAADAAALAGASDLLYGGVSSGAKNASQANGFTDSGRTDCATSNSAGEICVTVNNPPSTLSPHHHGDSKYVEVLVTKVQPTYFMRIFGTRYATAVLTARAVATNLGAGNNGGCLYTLGNSGDGIRMNGTPNLISAPNCGIIDDADFRTNGHATVNAASIGVVGSVTTNGGANFPGAQPVSGMPVAADPLSYLTPPPSGCSGSTSIVINGTGKVQTLSGNYCGGVTINGTNNQITLNPASFSDISINGSGNTVTFNPGRYVVTGSSGLSDNGNNSVLNGDGVTFYISQGTVNFNGSTGGTLSAPTTGADAGMLFWEPKSNTNGLTLNGKSTFKTDGIFYAPGGQLRTNGNNTFSAYMIVVVNSILMNGNNTLNLNADMSSLPGGSPIKRTVLVE